MGKYEIRVDSGIIRIKLFGTHTKEDAVNLIKEADKLLLKNRPGLVLTDLSSTGKPLSGARKVHADNIRYGHEKFKKIAFFGASVTNRVMANFIIKASGKSDKVRYFKTESDAVKWLNV
jgi:hypothetical protein